MRLGDLDAIDRKIVEMTREPAYQHTGEIWLHGLCMAMEAVNKAHTIDAVPVVRCKDCWNTTEVDGCMGTVLYCHVCDRDVDGEHFCSYGERRGDG